MVHHNSISDLSWFPKEGYPSVVLIFSPDMPTRLEPSSGDNVHVFLIASTEEVLIKIFLFKNLKNPPKVLYEMWIVSSTVTL